MIVLAMLIAWYAVYGAGRQVVVDAREGVRFTRERAVRRVGEIRKDRKAPRVKRMAATGAVWTGQGAGVVWRGARHTGRTITTGVRWGAGEGRERHRERVELGEVQARIGELGDRETDAGITDETPEYTALHEEFYALRDQHRADRAGRAGRPVPAKVAARIDQRRAQTEATDQGVDPDPPKESGSTDTATTDTTSPEPPDGPGGPSGQAIAQDAVARMDAADELLQRCGNCDGHGANTDLDNPDVTHTCRDCGGDGVNRHYPNAYAPDHPYNTNGGTTTMSTPVSTVNGAGLQSLRAAWGVFGDVNGEQVASSADAQGHVAALTDSVTTTLDDARMAAAAAGEVLAALADSGAATAEDVADAEAQQAQAQAQVTSAEEALVLVEQLGVAISALLSGAEAGQAHCAASLTGLNDRWAPTEAFVQH